MTSLATIIGLLPMALKLGAGSEAYAPLARAILGGLSVSVALTVFLVPAAYLLVYGERDRASDASGCGDLTNHASHHTLICALAVCGSRHFVWPAADCTSRWLRPNSSPSRTTRSFPPRSTMPRLPIRWRPNTRLRTSRTCLGSFTSVGADNGSRLAAGGLNNPIVYNRIGSGLSIGQMITDFGRTSNLIAMAKLQASAQDQVTETTRAQILLNTSRAYFALLRAQALLKVADQTVAARQTVSDQVTALAESKLKSNLDVSFANVNLADAKLLLVQAQSDLKAAEADLATAMGLPERSGVCSGRGADASAHAGPG